MKQTKLLISLPVFLLTAGVQLPGPIKPQFPTIIISYCACTGGGDYQVDSGQVIVPEHLRSDFVSGRCKMSKLYGPCETIATRAAAQGYQVWNLRATTLAAWDSLFTPPNIAVNDSMPAQDREIQAAYWHRQYRVTGIVVGINGPFPVFKIKQAVLVKNKRNRHR